MTPAESGHLAPCPAHYSLPRPARDAALCLARRTLAAPSAPARPPARRRPPRGTCEDMAADSGPRLRLSGDWIVGRDGSPTDAAELQGKIIGLFFCADWCGPCREYTPQLVRRYLELRETSDKFEVIFVSADKDMEAALNYFESMPWKMLSFEQRELQRALIQRYEIKGIPSLVLLDENGCVFNKDARELVLDTPLHEWRGAEQRAAEHRLALKALRHRFHVVPYFSQAHLVDRSARRLSGTALQGKVLGLYFGASWCPPCREFTPKLAQVYKALQVQGKPFEVIYVSADRSKDEADAYFQEMPWTMVHFLDKAHKQQLTELFEVEGIPSLILLDERGVITKSGRQAVTTLPFEEWRDFDRRRHAEEQRVRQEMQGLPERLLIPEHAHALTKMSKIYRGYYDCDICSGGGQGWVYHCTECDFDVHPQCAQGCLARHQRMLAAIQTPAYPDVMTLLEHDHVLKKEEMVHGGRYSCGYCRKQGVQWVYHCQACGFDLHPDCAVKCLEENKTIAKYPATVWIPTHPHLLRKICGVYDGFFGCNLCQQTGTGWVFHCDQCGYDVHPECVKQILLISKAFDNDIIS